MFCETKVSLFKFPLHKSNYALEMHRCRKPQKVMLRVEIRALPMMQKVIHPKSYDTEDIIRIR